ncbi:anti-repressor SinI family protein [Bacillus sp. UNC41MFS5]|nr:anti-repressor SinI family protein [Bacillus sp. UNC41MFS5]
MVITESKVEVIDQEWIALILEAKDLGLSIEAVRDFLVSEK